MRILATFVGNPPWLRLIGRRPRAPQHEELADLLDRRAVERFRDAGQHGLPLVSIVIEYTDLDELVRSERNVDFVNYGGREPVMPDRIDRMQAVRACTQLTSRSGRQRIHPRILSFASRRSSIFRCSSVILKTLIRLDRA